MDLKIGSSGSKEKPPPKRVKRRTKQASQEYCSKFVRYELDEELKAIGFLGGPVARGMAFESLVKDWYAQYRPARIISTETDGDAFDDMIVSFMSKYGHIFWPEASAKHGHLTHASSQYRPRQWRRRVDISFCYPRDALFRRTKHGKIRNSTQPWQPKDQIGSWIFNALKPYFLHLHYLGRKQGEDVDPKGFENWKAQSEELRIQWIGTILFANFE